MCMKVGPCTILLGLMYGLWQLLIIFTWWQNHQLQWEECLVTDQAAKGKKSTFSGKKILRWRITVGLVRVRKNGGHKLETIWRNLECRKQPTFSKQLSKKANKESCDVTNDLCSMNRLNICQKSKNYLLVIEHRLSTVQLNLCSWTPKKKHYIFNLLQADTSLKKVTFSSPDGDHLRVVQLQL